MMKIKLWGVQVRDQPLALGLPRPHSGGLGFLCVARCSGISPPDHPCHVVHPVGGGVR